MAVALRYTLALHVVGVAVLVMYGLTQKGTSGVAPALTRAGDAYAEAWLFFN